jgi:hypothetical protein
MTETSHAHSRLLALRRSRLAPNRDRVRDNGLGVERGTTDKSLRAQRVLDAPLDRWFETDHGEVPTKLGLSATRSHRHDRSSADVMAGVGVKYRRGGSAAHDCFEHSEVV